MHERSLTPMAELLRWLRKHQFEAYLISFLLMILPAALLYFAAQHGRTGWIVGLLVPIILGNLLAIIVDHHTT